MVGNDIVDLRDPDSDFASYRDGFDERVFTQGERASIAGSATPERQRWRLWAAKEASYKLARKLDPSTIFSPIAFALACSETHDPSSGSRVRIANQDVSCFDSCSFSCIVEFHETGDRIHAIAVPTATATATAFGSVLSGVGPITSADRESCEVRELACDAISQHFEYARGSLEIRKSPQRIPELYYRDEPQDISVSLSHHGGWLAFACRTATRTGVELGA